MDFKIDLKPLIDLKLHIEKLKADHESELRKLNEEYESKIQELITQHKDRLDRAGELYDDKNNVSIIPVYANREVNAEKLYQELPDKYWKLAHIPYKELCESYGKLALEQKLKERNQEQYIKLAKIRVEDAKKELTKREMEDYWKEREITKYDIDLKIT